MASSVTFEELLDTFPGGGFAADVTPMPLTRGAVNRVYRVPHPAGDLVLRRHASPAQRRVLGADLDVELQLQAQAASAGFAPPVLHHDADLGVTWMPFVDAIFPAAEVKILATDFRDSHWFDDQLRVAAIRLIHLAVQHVANLDRRQFGLNCLGSGAEDFFLAGNYFLVRFLASSFRHWAIFA
jgi:hypothetical protein